MMTMMSAAVITHQAGCIITFKTANHSLTGHSCCGRCVQLSSAIQQVLSREGAVKPDKCRFFRGQMSTIIGRALAELGIEPIPSRRCFALLGEALSFVRHSQISLL